MSLLSDPEVLRQVLVDRTHALPIVVGEKDAPAGSRIGGAAPAPLASAPPRCPGCGRELTYFFTLEEDLLAPLLPAGRALSALFCPDVECRLRSDDPVPDPSLVVLAHDAAPRAKRRGRFQSDLPGRALAFGPLTRDEQRFGRRTRPLELSKVGGTPFYVQEEDWKGEQLEREGLRFLFQWNEGSYPRVFFTRELPLFGGGMWVFAELDPSTHRIGSVLRAFWERT